jgi:hypothetical protein
MHKNLVEPVNSLKIFTDKLIDYAGLFPPASLDMAQSLNNYLFYMQGPYSWMLSNFIIPAKRLSELEILLKGIKTGDKIPLSVIGTGSETKDNFMFGLDDDVRRLIDFKSKYFDSFQMNSFEFRLPSQLVADGSIKEISELMNIISKVLLKSGLGNSNIFFEGVINDRFDESLIKIVEAVSLSGGETTRCGFKFRTGGTEAEAFPSTMKIASAIITCLEYNVPVKCTAGLHHPIRHYNESVSAVMHGFLNVFGAGIFAYTSDLDEAEIDEILNEEEPFDFYFTDEGLSWHDYSITNFDIKNARDNFMISYGSCSFDEPVEDLKTMELL